MKKKLLSILLTFCMVLTLLPTAAFAEGNTEEELPACTCKTACTAENMNADCPVCGAEGASAENCAKYIKPADDAAVQPEGEVSDPQPETALTALIGGSETVTEVSTAEKLTVAIKDYTVTTVKLATDIVFDGTLTVTRAVKLDLNGFTLKFANPRQIPITTYGRNTSFTQNYPIGILVEFQVSQSGQLTLADGSEAATGRLEMTGVNDVAIFVTGGGTLTMTGGTITNSYSGEISGIPDMTGIAILRGTATMTGGRIENQKQMGVWVCASTFTMGGNAVISGCGTATGSPSFVGGGVLVQYNCAPYEKNDPQRTIISSYFTLEGGAKIENCAARIGGGVCVGDNCLFTMTGGSITGCTAYTEGGGVVTEGYGPGGTFADPKPVFIMTGGSISDCNAGDTYGGTGGGVSVGGMLAGSTTLSAFEMTGGTITGCKAVNGGGVNIQGSSSFTMTNGSITGCEGLLGGGVELRQAHTGVAPTTFTMSGGSITGCKAADATDASCGRGGGVYMGSGCQLAMSGNARITGCEAARSGSSIYGTNDASYPWQVPLLTRSDNAQVDKGVSMDYALQLVSGGDDFKTVRMDGLGTKESPYEIGTADQLKLFRQIVNGAQTDNQNAVLLPQNTAACAVLTNDIVLNDGTFDENGNYTTGASGKAVETWTPIAYSGPFTVDTTLYYTGTFDGQGHAIKGMDVSINDAPSIEDQVCLGLFSTAKNAVIRNVTVTGYVSGYAGNLGGIVGYLAGGTIENCANYCTVTDTSAAYEVPSYVGGIAGAVNCSAAIRDCYNTGKLTEYVFVRYHKTGGIVGYIGSSAVSNCYNVGKVAGKGWYNGEIIGFIAGEDEEETPSTINNCYYLNTTNEAVGNDADTVTNTGPKTAVQFGNGTVLALLINGRADSAHPWNSQCKYLAAAGRTLPVFKTQTGDAHTHTWGAWTSNGDGTRTHTCPCGVSETVNYSSSSSRTYYTIQATAGTGGAISPSGNVSVRGGRDQVFTITPDQGYAVSDVKIDGESVGAVTSYSFENVRKAHTIAVSFAKAKAFVDVPAGSYYEDAVNWAVENGITQGTDDTHFSPDDVCTRAQMVTFLWRAAGSPKVENGKNPFTDVQADAYYYDAVLWAVEKGVTSGTSATTFSPDATVTRGQTVTFLYRNAGSPEVSGTMPFTDVEADAYYAKAVQWAVQQKITTGTSETTFSPMSDCTRGQIVTFLYRAK